MSQQTVTAPIQASNGRLAAGTAITLLTAAAGLAYVKWIPSYAKALTALSHHTLGGSIVSGMASAPPALGLAAAWQYALAYYGLIWQALALALVLGASVQVLVPRRWIHRLFGRDDFRSIAIAGAFSLGGMMCTCCTAPIALGLRRQHASAGSAMALLLGNPVLNPAVLFFIAAVLGWQLMLVRLLVGIALVFGVATLANRWFPQPRDMRIEDAPIENARESGWDLMRDWLKLLWWEIYTILPGYIAIVFLLGAARAWLFTPHLTLAGGGIFMLIGLAVVGTLFVIPTAGEIPIVQTLMSFGLSTAAAAVLLITLPAISLPSLYIVRSAFPRRLLATAMGAVAVAGLIAGAAVSLLPNLRG
ncbi:MAG TPA: permease [Candidatus Tyrphobacter sp.]